MAAPENSECSVTNTNDATPLEASSAPMELSEPQEAPSVPSANNELPTDIVNPSVTAAVITPEVTAAVNDSPPCATLTSNSDGSSPATACPSAGRKKGGPRGRKRKCLPKDAPKAPLSGEINFLLLF